MGRFFRHQQLRCMTQAQEDCLKAVCFHLDAMITGTDIRALGASSPFITICTRSRHEKVESPKEN